MRAVLITFLITLAFTSGEISPELKEQQLEGCLILLNNYRAEH